MIDPSFWKNRKVFITGHTGFKGSWLCMWLYLLGAKVTGYALSPPTDPSLFELVNIEKYVKTFIADIRDAIKLRDAINESTPEVVIHMAAQPLVRDSYKYPVETYSINVMGTINLLEAVRQCESIKAVVNITTDKVYENKEWLKGYRETEPLGGYDPYSSSKACSELVTGAYRNSYFNPGVYSSHGVGLATARAGNVIGGGDWAIDRLIPDCIRSFLKGKKVFIRNPSAIRPWQFVLEPLCGYLMLTEKLIANAADYSAAWNFGPNYEDEQTVGWVVKKLFEKMGVENGFELDNGEHPHEAGFLKLDCSLARSELGWRPVWSLEKALQSIADWSRSYQKGDNVADVCFNQIDEFSHLIIGV